MQCWIKKTLFIVAGWSLVFLASASATPPLSDEGYFVALHGGVALPEAPNHILQNGYSAGGEYGYRDDNYRSFVQLDYTNNAFVSPNAGDYNLFDLMLNLVYDIHYQGSVVPFFGAGMGYLDAWENNCSTTISNCTLLPSHSRVAYQGIAGLGFRLHQFRLDVRYRYLSFFNNRGVAENIPEVVLSYYFNPSKHLD